MAQHVKPTLEELKAQEEAIIAEAEELAKNPQPEAEEEIPVDTELEAEESPEVVEEEHVDPSEEDKAKLQEKLEAEKKRSSASARENQKIYAKNRVINQALEEADELPEPTEDEMRALYKDYDEQSEVNKELLKETVITKRWRQKVSEAKEQARKIEKWNESVIDFTDNPQTFIDYPDLEGKGEDFKEYASRDENNSIPFNVLVSAFLHDNANKRPTNSGRMFEKGSGGPNEKPQPKNGSITLEEARLLRTTNYAKYKEYLKAGKIEANV